MRTLRRPNPPSNIYGPQSQFSVVAGPRNQFYRTGRSLTEFGLFFIRLDTGLDHLCDLAHNPDD